MDKEKSEIDLIKDFLKSKGYKSTLECLEKEENFKNSDKKKVSKLNNISIMYRMMINNQN